jgi:hypothetical protein
MTEPPKNVSFKPSRLTALLITLLIVGLAVHDQLRDGQLTPTMAGLLLVLIAFWSGRGGDKLLERWLGK